MSLLGRKYGVITLTEIRIGGVANGNFENVCRGADSAVGINSEGLMIGTQNRLSTGTHSTKGLHFMEQREMQSRNPPN